MQIANSTALVKGANRGLARVLAEALLERGVTRVYAGSRDRHARHRRQPPDQQRRRRRFRAAAERRPDRGRAGDGDQLRRHLRDDSRLGAADEANGGGAIVDVLSTAGLARIPAFAGYSASKAGAHSLTQSVRADLGPRRIVVHGVYPAGIGTEMLAPAIPHSEPSEFAAGLFDGVEAEAEDIFPCRLSTAESVVYPADPKAL